MANWTGTNLGQAQTSGRHKPQANWTGTNLRTMSAAESEDYHSEQIATMKAAGADFVTALTFTSTDEAIGANWTGTNLSWHKPQLTG